MRVLHIIEGLAEAAGTSLFCREICGRSAKHGIDAALFSPIGSNSDVCELRQSGAQVCISPASGRLAIRRSKSLERFYSDFCPDVVHLHGLWRRVVHSGAALARAKRTPILYSPHGMLTPWAINHHRLRKRIAWHIYQHNDLVSARLLHATSTQEAKELRALGFSLPIAILPVGMDVPASVPTKAGGKKRLLFLSRIHPKKGLFNLADAWAQIPAPDWEVVIAGPDEDGHLEQVRAHVRKLGLASQFSFIGPVFGEEKRRLYQSASLFVLPSFSENFGAVVTEALANGLPVITTRATPWAELEEAGCGWCVNVGVKPLVTALQEALALSAENLEEMGARGRQLVTRKYEWDKVAAGIADVYRWLIAGDPKPGCLFEDQLNA